MGGMLVKWKTTCGMRYLYVGVVKISWTGTKEWQTYNLMLLLQLSRSVMSNSVQPHRQQPTRHPRPWDSPGKNTEVGCHFLLQCRKVKSESEAAQSHPTPSDPMDFSPLGSSVHGTFQTRVLEWVAIAFSAFLPWDVTFTGSEIGAVCHSVTVGDLDYSAC